MERRDTRNSITICRGLGLSGRIFRPANTPFSATHTIPQAASENTTYRIPSSKIVSQAILTMSLIRSHISPPLDHASDSRPVAVDLQSAQWPLTHLQDDDLIAAWIGRLAQFCNLRGGDCRRLIAPAISHEGDNVGGILI